MSPLFKVYKKVVEFSFTKKLFWVLVFSIGIQYFAYPTDRSLESRDTKNKAGFAFVVSEIGYWKQTSRWNTSVKSISTTVSCSLDPNANS